MAFSPTRDALNPNVDVQALKNRLWAIDHYKYRYGADHTYWVHSSLRRLFTRLNTYKLNYALKGFLAYQAVSSYRHYSYMDSMSLMSHTERATYHLPIMAYSGAFLGVCALL